jgi:hypothetical protein
MASIVESTLADCTSIEASGHIVNWWSPAKDLVGCQRRCECFLWQSSWMSRFTPEGFTGCLLIVAGGVRIVVSLSLIVNENGILSLLLSDGFRLQCLAIFKKMHVCVLSFQFSFELFQLLEGLARSVLLFLFENLSPGGDLERIVKLKLFAYFPSHL